jgi:large subunit ribosomal protein L10
MREEKKGIVKEIKRKLKDSSILILTDHTGLSSSQMNELRSLLRKKGSMYVVVKNRLLKRSLDKELLEAFEAHLTGPTALAISGGDSAALSKIIVTFADQHEAPKIKAGILEGNVVTARQIGAIASLPPRDVLLAQFMSGMRGPISGFAGVLRETLRQFISIVDQIRKKES